MAATLLDNLWKEMPNNIDFRADTLEKAIVKLHRLNATQHSSMDDWHLNMIEATKDLADENQQLAFLEYLSNPMGFKAKHELWDNLEKWQLENTRKTVQKMVQHTPVDWDSMTEDSKVIGGIQYIHVKHQPEVEDEKLDDIPEMD